MTRRWSDTYCEALADLERIANSRGLMTAELRNLIADLMLDALAVERQLNAKLQRDKLRVAREEKPLFRWFGDEP